ncbi:MAG TPA: AraC family transcriptional regulator [Pseudoxanthomonas sp.]|nr:AraC family transcriptional regulator [Pseudoxanthomonas sp.]
MSDRPACYPLPPAALATRSDADRAPLLDVLTSPVPQGVFDSPVDGRHVLCLHLGTPVPVSYRMDGRQRSGVRLHGQYCVVPAGASTRWVVSQPARSLLLRLTPSLWQDTAQSAGARSALLSPAIHVRDAQVERIGWMMQAEEHDAYPSGRLFTDSLATALAMRLLSLQSRRPPRDDTRGRALPAWRLRRVQEYVEAHLDEPLSLLELAAVAGYSGSHFKALFKQATGVAVHQYVLQRRVERARTLLLQGEQRIGDIALAAGFSHASHMARCLRRMLGIGPSQLLREATGVGRVAH